MNANIFPEALSMINITTILWPTTAILEDVKLGSFSTYFVSDNEYPSLREAHHLFCSKYFPELWRDVEPSHVTFDDVFVAEFGSDSSMLRVIKFG